MDIKNDSMLQHEDALQTENVAMRNETNKLNSEMSTSRLRVEEVIAREEKDAM